MNSLSQCIESEDLNHIFKMPARKSQLNPNAVPYIPISQISTEKTFKEDEITKSSKKSEPNDAIQSYDDLGLSPECFPNLVISEDFEDIFHDDTCETDQPNLIIESLGMMFPNTSTKCIEEILKLNHFDLGETLNMLDELEDIDFVDARGELDSPK